MATHYEVLGVAASASAAEIRAAYLDRARHLHPDATPGRSSDDLDATRRAMQDVNEAWRVLRDPAARAAYDSGLLATAPTASAVDDVGDGDEWLDRPFQRRPAQPGDLTVAFVRAAPWIAVLVVLAVIIVFTAFARHTTTGADFIGRCIVTEEGVPREAPCNEPNDGFVVDVVDEQSRCAAGTTPRVVASGDWYCLRSEAAG